MRPAIYKKLLILIPLAALNLAISDCSGPKLKWNGTIYVGSSTDQAVIGKKNGEIVVIPSSDERFDSMTCTDTFAELQSAYNDLLGKCERWAR